jgi:hypothetical protein
VIDQLAGPQFAPLWKEEVGAGQKDATLPPIIFEAINAIREAYRPFAPPAGSRQASDTLVTKSSWDLWLSSCLRHLLHRRIQSRSIPYSYLNDNFVERVLSFCRENLPDLRDEQTRIQRVSGMHYPLTKLVDMHFWETGYERELAKSSRLSSSTLSPADAG